MQIYLLQTDNMNSNVVTLQETKNILLSINNLREKFFVTVA